MTKSVKIRRSWVEDRPGLIANPISHLRGEGADAVFVQQMAQRADRHLQQLGGPGLIAGGFSQCLDDVGLFKVVEVG